jgi:hypothetical protein
MTLAFQLCYEICHKEGPREPERTETEWLLAYADDVNILGQNIGTIQKNTKALVYASKEVGLEANSEKIKYMLMSRKKAGKKHGMKKANTSFEGVAKFKYLGIILTDQNCMQKEIKSGLIQGMLATFRSSVFCLPAC